MKLRPNIGSALWVVRETEKRGLIACVVRARCHCAVGARHEEFYDVHTACMIVNVCFASRAASPTKQVLTDAHHNLLVYSDAKEI